MRSALLSHLPFFEALAGLEEGDDRWQAAKAGLLTLRLVDKAWDAALQGERVERWEIAAVVDAVESVDQGNVVRRLLEQIIASLAEGAAPAFVLPRLGAYARALQFEAQWVLAGDVYRSVLGYSEGAEHGDLASSSACQLGYCLRMAGDLDGAAEAYARGRVLAQACDDEDGVLRADIGEAGIAMHRGNLPEAEARLDAVIVAAEMAGRTDMLSRALQDRAQVAGRRGELDASVVFAYRSLQRCGDPTRRDRILCDIANSLGSMGHHEAARQAFQVLAVTAQEQYLRWLATVNLVELATRAGSEPLFEQYRRDLAGAELPPMLAGYFHLYVGEGCLRFKRYPSAKAAFERAVALAQKHDVNEVLFRAEAALSELGHFVSIGSSAPPPASAAVAHVIRAIGNLHNADEVTGVRGQGSGSPGF